MDSQDRVSAALRSEDPAALDAIAPLVYAELRNLAGRFMKRERDNHTLQPTALANEAYLRLVDQNLATVKSREHFMSFAARIMRRVLVDHARKKNAAKRGGGLERHSLALVDVDSEPAIDVLEVHAALEELAEHDARKARVVELRFFAGRTIPEVAAILGIAPKTAEADWYMARAWLRRRMDA